MVRLPEAEKTRAVDEILWRAAATPFDLSSAPLWRARLLRLGEREHVLVLTLHHIIADEWSLGLLIDELASFIVLTTWHCPVPTSRI